MKTEKEIKAALRRIQKAKKEYQTLYVSAALSHTAFVLSWVLGEMDGDPLEHVKTLGEVEQEGRKVARKFSK